MLVQSAPVYSCTGIFGILVCLGNSMCSHGLGESRSAKMYSGLFEQTIFILRDDNLSYVGTFNVYIRLKEQKYGKKFDAGTRV